MRALALRPRRAAHMQVAPFQHFPEGQLQTAVGLLLAGAHEHAPMAQVFGKGPEEVQHWDVPTVPPDPMHAAASSAGASGETSARGASPGGAASIAESAGGVVESAAAESAMDESAGSVPVSAVLAPVSSDVAGAVAPSSSEHPARTAAVSASEARRARFMARW